MTQMSSPQQIVEQALSLSKTDGCVVIADETSGANLRWANNTLTTNGVARTRRLTVIALVAGAEGVAAGVVTRSNVTPDRLEPLVRAAEQAAADNGPAEDATELVSAVRPGLRWDEGPAETSIEVFSSFAPALGEAFARGRAEGRALFGFAEHKVMTTYLGTSTGVRLRHAQPSGTVEINAKSADHLRSAWAGAYTPDFSDVDVPGLDTELTRRLAWAERRVELPAGRYETILPPSAVADLLIYLAWSAGGRDTHDGRTVFSHQGGGTRVGEELATLPVTLRSDPSYPGLECAPFVVAHASAGESSVFDNGLPLPATEWISGGRLAALLQTRHSARLCQLPVTPAIDNLVLEGPGDGRGIDAMVADTARGLLVTCLWYIREVDPQTLLLTGLTRDGVYLVEGGEVVGGVNNFRFNESPVDLLGRLSEVGATERTLPREFKDWFTRTAMPPLRIPDFNMSSVSQAS